MNGNLRIGMKMQTRVDEATRRKAHMLFTERDIERFGDPEHSNPQLELG
jgi:hypothetical protein